LEACLRRLAACEARCDVSLGEGMGTAAAWRLRFPEMRFTEGGSLTVPLRRRAGVERANSEFVALLEDTSLPEPGWLRAATEALARPHVVAVSGPVRIDPALPAQAQALACTEYGRSFPGRLTRPAGNNLAYRRSTLLGMLSGHAQGLLESEVHAAFAARGFNVALHAGMSVTYAAPDPRGIRLATRFHHGRLYAGERARGWSWPARLAWTVGSLLLPAVLAARSLGAMVRAVRPALWLPTTFWICVMETAWSAGEATGYLAGAGSSMREWR
jgi:hypothetical protein